MNLHVFQDDLGHYINLAIDRINRIEPKRNIYVNIKKSIDPKKSSLYYLAPSEMEKFIQCNQEIERIYFHFFSYRNEPMLNKFRWINSNLTFVWIFWSGDFYNLPEFRNEYYLDYAKEFLGIKKKQQLKKWKRKAASLKSVLLKRPVYRLEKFVRSICAMDYIATVFKGDYEHIIHHTRATARFKMFSYVSYQQLIGEEMRSKFRIGNAIMVNHNADPILNHFEVLEVLAKKKLSNKVYLPLAYGDAKYADAIKKEATKFLGEKAEIQDQFIPLSLYNQNLFQLGYAIFNNQIQKGFGNILVLIWIGVKVFLREENAVYCAFKEWGIHVFSIQHDLPAEAFDTFLSKTQVLENRQVVEEKFSEEKLELFYREFLSLPKVNEA